MIISTSKKKPSLKKSEKLSNVIAASITGIDNSKEYLEASYRLKPINKPAVIIIPDLLVPGIRAKIWNNPMMKASFKFKLLINFLILRFVSAIPSKIPKPRVDHPIITKLRII